MFCYGLLAVSNTVLLWAAVGTTVLLWPYVSTTVLLWVIVNSTVLLWAAVRNTVLLRAIVISDESENVGICQLGYGEKDSLLTAEFILVVS